MVAMNPRIGSLGKASMIWGLLFPLISPVWAQVNVTARLSQPEAAVGEQLYYIIEIHSEGSQVSASRPPPPQVDGLTFTGAGTQQNYSMTNGRVSATVAHHFVIEPQRAGEFTIPATTVDVNGQAVSTAAVKLVVREGAPRGRPQPGAAAGAQGRASGGVSAQDVKLHVEIPKREIYVGQAIPYQLFLLSRVGIEQVGREDAGSFAGFTTEDLEEAKQQYRVEQGGLQYTAVEISRRLLIPTKAGSLEIQPESLVARVRMPRQRQHRRIDPLYEDPFGDSILDDFFGSRAVDTKVKHPPQTIKVLDLPKEGRPANFSGLVGRNMVLTAQADRTQLKQDDVLTLKLVLKGEGDVRLLKVPQIDVGEAFKMFPPKTKPQIDVRDSGISGTMTFEIVLGPRTTGDVSLPPVEFSYFDFDKKQYVTLKTEAIPVHVQPGEKEQVLSSENIARPHEVKVVGKDIQFLKEDASEIGASEVGIHRSPLFWAGLWAPWILCFATHLWRGRRDRLEGDVALMRYTRAYKEARGALKELGGTLPQMQSREAYDRLSEVLITYLGHKRGRPPAGIVVEELDNLMAGTRATPEQVTELRELLSRSEMARFAPANAAVPDSDLARARDIVDRLEEVL